MRAINGVGDTLELWDGEVTPTRARVGVGSVSCRATAFGEDWAEADDPREGVAG